MVSLRFSSLATLLFNQPSRSILPRFSRPPIVGDTDERYHSVSIER